MTAGFNKVVFCYIVSTFLHIDKEETKWKLNTWTNPHPVAIEKSPNL